jgi:hypothetical protein
MIQQNDDTAEIDHSQHANNSPESLKGMEEI